MCCPTSHSCSEKSLVETLPGTEEKARGNTEASIEEPPKSLSPSSLPSAELGGEPPEALGAAGRIHQGPLLINHADSQAPICSSPGDPRQEVHRHVWKMLI